LGGAPNSGGSTNVAGAIGNPHRMVLCDEGNKRLTYLDLDNSASGWNRAITGVRDIQLIGKNLVGVSTPTGYQELDLAAGTVIGVVSQLTVISRVKQIETLSLCKSDTTPQVR
jgi:hypothetical protein